MAYGKLAAGVALGALAVATSATAQDARRLDIGLSALVEHQSNVAQTSKDQAALRGLSLDDTIFTPSASIDIVQPVGRQALFVQGSLGYSFYQNNDELNREQADITGGVRGSVGPCGYSLAGSYARGLSRIDDPTLITDVENIQEVKRVSIDAACARESGIGLVAGYATDWTTNDLPASQLSDVDTETATLGVQYARPALGTVTLFGTYGETTYPNRIIEDGYDLYSVGLSYERRLGARIEGKGSFAYTRVDSHAPAGLAIGSGDDEFETTAYAVELSYRASSRLRFGGSFERAVNPATGIGRNYDITESYEVHADYDMGSRIALSFGAARVERESGGGLALPIIQLTDSTTDAVYGSARYKLSERISFRLTAGHEERSTNAPQFDYTNDRIGVGVDAKF